MTIEEYSTRMGYLGFCSDEEYATADAIYLNAGNLDKDAFCADYKKHKGSVIIETLGDRVNSQSIWIRDQETKIQSTAHALLREADEIRQGGMEASADAIDKIAATLIGRKDCIKWKLHKGFALSETDNEYITDNFR